MIRRAQITDIPAIAQLINDAAEYGLMLHRSLAYLYEHARDFHVAVDQQKPDRVIGACGLSLVWANLAEVYALAVDADHRGKGIGRELVTACIDEAELLGIRKVIALTYEQAFFDKSGFVVIDRQQLPLKLWNECVRCSKNAACDEIAMVKVIESVPEVAVPHPGVPPLGQYVVPVTVTLAGPKQQHRQKMDEPH